jgi:hypothetical protein
MPLPRLDAVGAISLLRGGFGELHPHLPVASARTGNASRSLKTLTPPKMLAIIRFRFAKAMGFAV